MISCLNLLRPQCGGQASGLWTTLGFRSLPQASLLRQNVDEASAFWRRKKVFRRSYNSDQDLEAAFANKDGRNSDFLKKARCDFIKINKHFWGNFFFSRSVFILGTRGKMRF